MSERRPIRVLLADDQTNVRSALHRLLKHEPGVNVVGEASEAKELVSQVRTVHPDLVLIDWGLPGLSAIGSLPGLRLTNPRLLVIVMSGRPETSQTALAAGANAFVSKIDPPENLLETLHAMDSRPKDVDRRTA
jgi:DNA-binding NarL/FixJ family response regulator